MATIVDTHALLSVIVASLLAGVGVTVVFSLVIVAATRSAELERAGSRAGAVILAALSVIGVSACLAGIAFGIHVMASK